MPRARTGTEFLWCVVCGYDLRGLSEASTNCPECGGNVSDRGRWALRLVALGLALQAWGIPLTALAWVFTLAAARWVGIRTEGTRSPFQAEAPAWVLIAIVGLAPVLGMVILARVAPGGRTARSVAIGAALILASVLLLTAGYRTVFEYSGTFWSRLGLSKFDWLIPAATAALAAGINAFVLARLLVCLGLLRTARALRCLTWLAPAVALAGLVCAVVLSERAQSISQAAYEDAQQRTIAAQEESGGTGVQRVFMPRIPWLWKEGVPLGLSALYAWCGAFLAILWLAVLIIRARVHEALGLLADRRREQS